MAERARRVSIWDPGLIGQAVADSFRKLDPRLQFKNPVMFIVEVGSLVTTIVWIQRIHAEKHLVLIGVNPINHRNRGSPLDRDVRCHD